MVFDRALSEAEIQAIYEAQKPASIAKAEPTEPDLSGLASILSTIQDILTKITGKIKSLF